MWKVDYSTVVVLLTICIANAHVHVINKRQTPDFHQKHLHSIRNLYLNPELQEQTIIDSIQELALDLSATQWDRRDAMNMVQSPVSIGALLNLVLLGSRGDSHRELRLALRYKNTLPDALIHETYQKVLGSIGQQDNGVNVTMNTRLYLQSGLPILGDFSQAVQALYNSQIRGLDFINKPSESRDIVNKWVENTTYGKIKDLISKPFLTTTKFVAVNTIYFSGGWEFPFSKQLTYNGTFNTGTKNITIPMMSNLMNVPFYKGKGFDVISLPYKGGKYSMIIMTPTGKAGIKSLLRVEYELDANVISDLINKMTETRVSVTIPRMKLRHKVLLKADLMSLGVRSLFNQQLADFGRMTSHSGVYLEDIVHEAVLEISENGTVASAATATSFDRIGGNDYFQLNKPSLLFIKDTTTELTLFYARIVEPEPFI